MITAMMTTATKKVTTISTTTFALTEKNLNDD
jgi:hypothetical protein